MTDNVWKHFLLNSVIVYSYKKRVCPNSLIKGNGSTLIFFFMFSSPKSSSAPLPLEHHSPSYPTQSPRVPS